MAMMRLRREDPRVVGSYRLHRRLGAGGMGVVYLGSDKRGQRVALKVIRPDLAEDQEFRSRFAREVSAARRIRGGCTARLVAADLDADRPWFATQYVPGPSLHDKVNDEGPLYPAQVASIGAALSEGLLAVHDAGVVHRDLKPSNILLSPKGPRIIDFGIAWATGASTLTHVGTAVGSPGFLAPEQVRGAAVTPATDIFALGATLAYACTADSPFGQGSSEVMLYRVVHEEAHLAGVPDALAPLLASCLAKDPADRPSTLSLSLRLKEIAAREAQGLSLSGGPADGAPGTGRLSGGPGRGRPGRGPAAERGPVSERGASAERGPASERSTPARPRPVRPQADRPTGKRAEEYARQRTERRAANTPTPRPQAQRGGAARGPAPARTQAAPGASGAPGEAVPKSRGGRRPSGRPAVPGARTGRNGSRPAQGPRTSPGGRRPGPDRRLLRQRIIVFITVTLLVALGIAAAQGCQGPARSSGSERSVYTSSSVTEAPPGAGRT
ncbi:protein kinase [Streptomyces sp. NPDC007100]|uniref:serine/threonine protein kinase n=1 Tax=unclassified Streptomyces TaxID=2593676 RepID=UPI0033D4F4D6